MIFVSNPTIKKLWFKYSLTYIIFSLLFGGIVYLLPGYQDPDPEANYELSFKQYIIIGFGLAFVMYLLYLLVLFLFSLLYKKPLKLIVKAFISLIIVVILFISFGGMSETHKIQDIIQTLAMMAVCFSVPYIEYVIDKSQKSELN